MTSLMISMVRRASSASLTTPRTAGHTSEHVVPRVRHRQVHRPNQRRSTRLPPRPQASSDIYDPSTNTWSAAGDMSSPRAGHASVLLADGRALVLGGLDFPPGATETADIYSE